MTTRKTCQAEVLCDDQIGKIKKKDKNVNRNTKKWKEVDVVSLVEILKELPCLWDIYFFLFFLLLFFFITKREKREVAYKEIAEGIVGKLAK